MRTYASAYLIYGIKLDRQVDEDALQTACEAANKEIPGADVGYLDAGHFGEGRCSYFSTACKAVGAGEFLTLDVTTLHAFRTRDTARDIKALAHAVGVLDEMTDTVDVTAPGWMLVCDVDH